MPPTPLPHGNITITVAKMRNVVVDVKTATLKFLAPAEAHDPDAPDGPSEFSYTYVSFKGLLPNGEVDPDAPTLLALINEMRHVSRVTFTFTGRAHPFENQRHLSECVFNFGTLTA